MPKNRSISSSHLGESVTGSLGPQFHRPTSPARQRSGGSLQSPPYSTSFFGRNRAAEENVSGFVHIGPAAVAAAPPGDRVFVPHRGSLRIVRESNNESTNRHPGVSRGSSSNRSPSSGSASAPSSSSLSYLYTIEVFVDDPDDFDIDIFVGGGGRSSALTYELRFERQQYEFMSRLFSILDTESRGSVARDAVMEFVLLRCPVFRRRDEALRKLADSVRLRAGDGGKGGVVMTALDDFVDWNGRSPTFDEVWNSVVRCSEGGGATGASNDDAAEVNELGVEGWMVFCRFIALAQYQEAKRRFSARHLQQTMRQRNGPRGSEVVLIDVPPPEPPALLSVKELVEHEKRTDSTMPLPELDLDHSLLSAHDNRSSPRRSHVNAFRGRAKICLFGSGLASSPLLSAPSSSSSFSPSNLEFKVTYTPHVKDKTASGDSPRAPKEECIVVRRSFQDMEWLNDTFTSHRVLGGTLCGRILPPFPTIHRESKTSPDYSANDYSIPSSLSVGGGGGGGSGKMAKAAAAAGAGVGMITNMAKTLWGSYVSTSSTSPSSSPMKKPGTHSSGARVSRRGRRHFTESHHHLNSPIGKARQLERYLNYLLEHPALSTSFPLNTILKASQSGLDAAKYILEDHAKSQQRHRSHSPQLNDGKTSLLFWPTSLASPQQPGGSLSAGQQLDLSWVRTAAQAAMALKVHGILETTGCQSASARLQHASLPKFGSGSVNRDEDIGEGEGSYLSNIIGVRASRPRSEAPDDTGNIDDGEDEGFERGVVQVESQLNVDDSTGDGGLLDVDDGYDMLPLPIPAPERRILTDGVCNVVSDDSSQNNEEALYGKLKSSHSTGNVVRFRYGSPSERRRMIPGEIDNDSAVLGDMSVDDDIDKLREIIGSVDNTLGRCVAAIALIGKSRRKRDALHIDIMRGLDSWSGLRGQIISQRALLNGVHALDHSKDVVEESDLALIDDLSWQASLSASAVSAAEDVRSAVRASRTAANAKLAAAAAAVTAQKACETGKFSSVDEARAAQTRASIAQSHAIHAAVVEHEALAAKRRAALALAHDVKCWNVHRKRELLRACRTAATSQRDACRQAAEAWSCLLDGFLGSTVVPVKDEKRERRRVLSRVSRREEAADSSAHIFPHALSGDSGEQSLAITLITPVEHTALSKVASRNNTPTEEVDVPPKADAALSLEQSQILEQEPGHFSEKLSADPEGGERHTTRTETVCPDLGEASQGIVKSISRISAEEASQEGEESAHNEDDLAVIEKLPFAVTESSLESICEEPSPAAENDSRNEHEIQSPLLSSESSQEQIEEKPPTVPEESPQEEQLSPPVTSQEDEFKTERAETTEERDIMTDSMQSLADGLMMWGGQYDSEDDLSLPSGMAASIALEESGIFRTD